MAVKKPRQGTQCNVAKTSVVDFFIEPNLSFDSATDNVITLRKYAMQYNLYNETKFIDARRRVKRKEKEKRVRLIRLYV